MDKVLRPERLSCDPSEPESAQEWIHWKATFVNFLSTLPQENLNRKGVLINFVSPRNFRYIEDADTYEVALEALEKQFIKPKNEVYARHKLASRNQSLTESVDEFLQALKILGKDCAFQAVDAAQHRDLYIRDAFVRGLHSDWIRQRLLENRNLDLDTAFDQARALESATKQSKSYSTFEQADQSFNAAIPKSSQSGNKLDEQHQTTIFRNYRF